jgi:hypothetical protein
MWNPFNGLVGLQKLVISYSSCKSLHVHVKCLHRRMVREGEGMGIEYMLIWCLVRVQPLFLNFVVVVVVVVVIVPLICLMF